MKWIKCSERLPDKYHKSLIFRKNGVAFDCTFWFDRDGTRARITPNKQEIELLSGDDFDEWLDENSDSDQEKAFNAAREASGEVSLTEHHIGESRVSLGEIKNKYKDFQDYKNSLKTKDL